MTTTLTRPRNDPLPDSLTLYLESVGQHDLLTAAEEIELGQQIEEGRDAAARLESQGRIPAAEAVALRRAVRRGEEARERFISANLRLVVANARRYAGAAGLDMGDLVQEGNLGLMRAVDKFEWRRGFKFSTYATWWIRQALARAVAEKGRLVRIPGQLHDTLATIRGAASGLSARLGHPPSIAEIAAETGIDPGEVERALLVADEVSIDQPVGEDGALLGDFISDEDAEDVSVLAENAEISLLLRRAVARLDEREHRILTARYGFLDDAVPRTLEEIGGEFGLTPERIRQIEKRALAKLRHPAFGLREEDLVN
ncbi:MAG: putative polymerase sigma factor [Acidobacteria bacterium]|nr:putative polymerase sigma factor [Acidobacteriota bacterium]